MVLSMKKKNGQNGHLSDDIPDPHTSFQNTTLPHLLRDKRKASRHHLDKRKSKCFFGQELVQVRLVFKLHLLYVVILAQTLDMSVENCHVTFNGLFERAVYPVIAVNKSVPTTHENSKTAYPQLTWKCLQTQPSYVLRRFNFRTTHHSCS